MSNVLIFFRCDNLAASVIVSWEQYSMFNSVTFDKCLNPSVIVDCLHNLTTNYLIDVKRENASSVIARCQHELISKCVTDCKYLNALSVIRWHPLISNV